MKTFTIRIAPVVAVGLLGWLLGFVGRGGATTPPEQNKDFVGWTTEFGEDKKDLMNTGKNPYFILEPGHFTIMEAGDERIVHTVLFETKMVDGVETRVVEERETKGETLVEVSRNYYAISKRTNSVYYFGEEVDIYKNGKITSHEGSWMSGVKGAKYGLMMAGTPLVKGKYYQEIAPGQAMDRAEIISVTETMATPAGTFKNCLVTEETSAMEPDKMNKYYAPGIGQISDGKLKLVKHGFLDKAKAK
ncbi:MAG TPA: hypothetical protein VE988_28525 [Gemmataceae bacterium]|nr:hypothetical protein [Gemmataceae bacterium]